MDIRIIKEPVTLEIVSEIAREFHGNMVKGVADVKREIIAIGGEWHIDANIKLIGDSSKQDDLWGFNFYLDRAKGEEIEYKSLINIRPAQNNRTIEIQDQELKDKLEKIIKKLVV